MKVKVEQVTSSDEARRSCEFTFGGKSNIELWKLAKCEHSPLRTIEFSVEMYDIPTFVSVHLVRHKFGVEHFVKSNREDNTGVGNNEVTRLSPVNHKMHINAQALINMSRRRLCYKASSETRQVMQMIKDKCPDWLQPYLVRECFYRGYVCHELKPCDVIYKTLPHLRYNALKNDLGCSTHEELKIALEAK